jgi:dihydrofolate synthase/folylpolyglutamate synthase
VKSEELSVFLNSKPLYYKEIDHERVHIAYEILKPYIRRPKTVHIVGTNGKGKFNERIWIDGSDASDEILEQAHQKLFTILGQGISDSLSYFEYTTLLAFVVFENCDLMVLEAGLGGEFDATNVCDKELSVITPIGIDHQAFLGESIEEIAATKIRSIQKKVLLAPQVYDEVVEVAKHISIQKEAKLFLNTAFSIQRSALRISLENIVKIQGWGDYLIDNAMVALQALDILHINYKVNDLLTLELFGRFYQLTDNIRIDVGHNPLAAIAIEKALDEKVVLIYNSLDDKDYEEVLRILKPKVKRVEIMKINSQRATTLEAIEDALKNVGLEYDYFKNSIDNNEHYLVFGSFYVVEEFLKKYNVPK